MQVPIPFSVDPTPVRFYKGSPEQVMKFLGDFVHVPNPNRNKYDLENLTWYLDDGAEMNADIMSYNESFMDRLSEIGYAPEMMRMLDYHFSKAVDKHIFLDHVKLEILSPDRLKEWGQNPD